MGKCKGTPKKNHNPGWKAKRQEGRRASAEERQKKYEATPITDRLRDCGAKEREKLLKRQAAA